MNRKIRRLLASGKRQIEQRQQRAVRRNGAGPVLAASNIRYEMASKTKAIRDGGLGLIHRLARKLGLPQRIDKALHLLKRHVPYFESDHVLNIAYNALCGGQTLEDIELRRNSAPFLDALGAEAIPDPTTAGDFCRRFSERDLRVLQDVLNETRLLVWKSQPPSFFATTARIDADGSMVRTDGECKEGIDVSYKGEWGYHPLLVSLANTEEPLFIANRSGSRPSFEGVTPFFDEAIKLCRRAGFTKVLLRGDTDFARTEAMDRWNDDGVHFVFGYDAYANLVRTAGGDLEYVELERRAAEALKTKPRRKQPKVREEIVVKREFKNIKLDSEDVAEFAYKPTGCEHTYRMVVVRKNLTVLKGDVALLDDVRYFFYITNDRDMSPGDVVREANDRCDQENLISQLKSGVRALHAPVNTLNANWAYMIMAALAWSLKAWAALSLRIDPRWRAQHEADREVLLRMDFRTFYNGLIALPCQIVRSARRIEYRLLAWSPWARLVFRLQDSL